MGSASWSKKHAEAVSIALTISQSPSARIMVETGRKSIGLKAQ
jgi:hypothetical protein